MDGILENVGIAMISFLIIYVCKKILEFYDFKRPYVSEKVYNAADEFAHGASYDEVKAILTRCIDFDGDDAEKILSRSVPYRTEKDGGYRAFIKSVNKLLGQNAYNEQFHTQ